MSRSRSVITLTSVSIRRPRLLAASLAVAVVVGVGGGYVVNRATSDPDDDVSVLDDPHDRSIPTDEFSVTPNADVAGERLPDATLSDRDGADVTIDSLMGDKPLVINLWFSTCAPCAKELPEFAASDAEFGDQVRFVGVNPNDSVPVIERFAGERGVTYEQLRDDRSELTNGLGALNFPITLFVTSDGTIVDQTGPIDADGLRDKIADLQARETLL